MKNNVIDLEVHRREYKETGQFLELLEQEIQTGDRIKPLPSDLNSRIAALKAKAAKARAEAELLEG